MKTVSLKLPAGLHARLDRAARRKKQTKSAVVRAALEQFLNGKNHPVTQRTVSALDQAGDLVGCTAGPGDLSINPEYMQGFGE